MKNKLILLVLLVAFTSPVFSQYSNPQAQPYTQAPTPGASSWKPKGTVADDISAFFANKNVHRGFVVIVAVFLGYRRFKKKKLEERSGE
jgi:hypothetical protein